MEKTGHSRAGAVKGRVRARLMGFCAVLAVLLSAPPSPQPAQAAGDTRTLSFFHTHTNESATITFRRNGSFDADALKQLNWLLRDWRVGEAANMDPLLFDILWEVYRESGSRQPIHVISAYRSPATNGMLRQASSGVAENSHHMAGRAMDIRLPDVDTARLREVAMRLQYGGVGFYPSSQFVHVDTGNVRAWPRMSQDQLARLFPDGKTLHLPANGKPLSGYEQAQAEILPRNAALASGRATTGGGGSLGSALASLFRGKSDSAGETATAAASPQPSKVLAYAPAPATASAPPAATAFVPLPPRRPAEAPIQVASAGLGGEAAFSTGGAASSTGTLRSGAGNGAAAAGMPRTATGAEVDLLAAAHDERIALRALFSQRTLHPAPRQEPRITLAHARVAPLPAGRAVIDGSLPTLAAGFSLAAPGEPEAARFRGPAVQPLVARQVASAAY